MSKFFDPILKRLNQKTSSSPHRSDGKIIKWSENLISIKLYRRTRLLIATIGMKNQTAFS